MKADDAPAHATSQIQWREKRFDFTQLHSVPIVSFGRMKFFQAGGCVFCMMKKRFLTPLFFFSRRWCLKKALENVITLFLFSLLDALLL